MIQTKSDLILPICAMLALGLPASLLLMHLAYKRVRNRIVAVSILMLSMWQFTHMVGTLATSVKSTVVPAKIAPLIVATIILSVVELLCMLAWWITDRRQPRSVPR